MLTNNTYVKSLASDYGLLYVDFYGAIKTRYGEVDTADIESDMTHFTVSGAIKVGNYMSSYLQETIDKLIARVRI